VGVAPYCPLPTQPATNLRLLVEIGGVVPSQKKDIRLGDVVIGMPDGIHEGVVHYDLANETITRFERKWFLEVATEQLEECGGGHAIRSSNQRKSRFRIRLQNRRRLSTTRINQSLSMEKDTLFPSDNPHILATN
jgi:hypothetical protein